jgi:lysophospholipase L1-like esterase
MKDVIDNSGRWKVVVAVAVILAAFLFIPSARLDWFNLCAAAATLYLASRIGRSWSIASSPGPGFRVWSGFGRSMVIIVMILASGEFLLRTASLHRSLIYESHGDLLFTPAPNQEYVEKISISKSHTDQYGLRSGVSPAGRMIILCLGDSITYGYGVDDQDTYPARLQLALDQNEPRKYAVLNGGVNAYPVWLMHEKFLYLWNRGIRPDLVIVGYSMNEGLLTQLGTADLLTKAQFERRVKWKNYVRQLALYNVVVENWARHYYDRVKDRMIPGTHSMSLERKDVERSYERQLELLTADLRERQVPVVFVLFCSFNGRTQNYDAQGPFQKLFADFAEKHDVPLFSSEAALSEGLSLPASLKRYFIDACHMNARGTDKFGRKLASFLETRKFIGQENGTTADDKGESAAVSAGLHS